MSIDIVDLEYLLNPRIKKHSYPLYENEHFPEAAANAMKQVENAIRERFEDANISAALIGRRFVKSILSPQGVGIKLRVSFDDKLQDAAKSLFDGAYGYYRNYSIHDGSQIDKKTSFRIMVIASELLDLIGASRLSFEDMGGVEELTKIGLFDDKKQIKVFLEFLDGHTITDDVYDGFFESLYARGFNEHQLTAVDDFNLVRFCRKITPPNTFAPGSEYDPDSISWFELTDTGKKILSLGKDAQ